MHLPDHCLSWSLVAALQLQLPSLCHMSYSDSLFELTVHSSFVRPCCTSRAAPRLDFFFSISACRPGIRFSRIDARLIFTVSAEKALAKHLFQAFDFGRLEPRLEPGWIWQGCIKTCLASRIVCYELIYLHLDSFDSALLLVVVELNFCFFLRNLYLLFLKKNLFGGSARESIKLKVYQQTVTD